MPERRLFRQENPLAQGEVIQDRGTADLDGSGRPGEVFERSRLQRRVRQLAQRQIEGADKVDMLYAQALRATALTPAAEEGVNETRVRCKTQDRGEGLCWPLSC